MIEIGSITINPDAITALEDNGEYGVEWTAIKCGAETYIVPLKRSEVARKVLEYNLLMMQHRAYIAAEETYSWAHEAKERLLALAGLEESQ